MDESFYAKKLEEFENGPIEYVNMSGMKMTVFEPRHVRLVLPVDPIHMNHVGTVYAGSMFTMAEIAGANLFVSAYGDDFVPVLKGVEVRYVKPTKHDLVIDIALAEEEAQQKIALAAERGRGDYFLDVPIKDAEDVLVATAKFNYYAFTAEAIKDFGA